VSAIVKPPVLSDECMDYIDRIADTPRHRTLPRRGGVAPNSKSGRRRSPAGHLETIAANAYMEQEQQASAASVAPRRLCS
jgi:uncharacterized protein YfaQ (DUF2300 family)